MWLISCSKVDLLWLQFEWHWPTAYISGCCKYSRLFRMFSHKTPTGLPMRPLRLLRNLEGLLLLDGILLSPGKSTHCWMDFTQQQNQALTLNTVSGNVW